MEPSYYRRVDATGVCPQPDIHIKVMPTVKKKKKKKKKRRRKTSLGFSIQRLRVRVAKVFRALKRWRRRLCPYGHCVLLPWKPPKPRSDEVRWRSGSSSSSSTSALVYSESGNYKFYSEAIADCLEFIKRNSISLDDNKGLISLSDVYRLSGFNLLPTF